MARGPRPASRRRLRALVKLAAEAGTAGYPPDMRRRLKILNMIAYLIAVTTLIYAIQQSSWTSIPTRR